MAHALGVHQAEFEWVARGWYVELLSRYVARPQHQALL